MSKAAFPNANSIPLKTPNNIIAILLCSLGVIVTCQKRKAPFIGWKCCKSYAHLQGCIQKSIPEGNLSFSIVIVLPLKFERLCRLSRNV